MKSQTGEDCRKELLHQTQPATESWRLNLNKFRLPERSSADPPSGFTCLLHHMSPSMHDFGVVKFDAYCNISHVMIRTMNLKHSWVSFRFSETPFLFFFNLELFFYTQTVVSLIFFSNAEKCRRILHHGSFQDSFLETFAKLPFLFNYFI